MNAERHATLEVAKIQVYGRMENMVAKLKNISSTGAFLELVNGDYVPRTGDFVRVTVHLNSVGKTHEVNGEVMWHEALGFGVHFVKKEDLVNRMMQKAG